MPLAETAPALGLESLPKMYRNKPNNNELYGFVEGLPSSSRGSTKMLLLNPDWQDQLSRRLARDAERPERHGDRVLSDDQVDALRELSDQAACVASLGRLIGRGPGELSLETGRLASTDMNDFIQANPHLFVTAREDTQEGKDPRYVARLSSVNPYGYTYSTKEVKFDVEVETIDGVRGKFPQNTRDWQLAHLAVGPMVFIASEFQYLNDGYR